MGFLTSLFGETENSIVTILFGLAIVLVLIVLGVWALKLLFGATGNVARGRSKRLSVIEVSPVDQRRQLVLIRRDDVEHLLLIGGESELVIETGIAADPAPNGKRPSRRATSNASTQNSGRREPSSANAVAAVTMVDAPHVDAEDPDRPFDRLREMADNKNQRGSLRHTGLLRPVSRQEPQLIPTQDENSQLELADSVTNTQMSAPDNDDSDIAKEPQAANSDSVEGNNKPSKKDKPEQAN